MNREKRRIGVLGLGEGRSILSAILSSSHWELAQACDLNVELCRQREVEFGLRGFTQSYDEMLRDKSIDTIGIYTPDQLHGRHIRMALEAGKNVICTKPVLASLGEAKETIAAQKASGKMVFVGQSSRFFEPMIHQRRDWEAGLHGQLLGLETHYHTDGRWFLEKGWSVQRGFSWMFNFLIHAVDLARWYLPDIETVTGYGVRGPHTAAAGLDCEDTMTFLLREPSGRFATVSGSYGKPNLSFEAEAPIQCILRGSEGISKAEYPRLSYSTHWSGDQENVTHFDQLASHYFRFEGVSHHAGEYQNYIDYVAQCLDKGKTPVPDLAEAVRTLAVLEAMARCLKFDHPISVSEVVEEFGFSNTEERNAK